MPPGIIGVVLVVCAALLTALPTRAQNKTFADLLAQAKSQAAAGHRWDPPGDNTTDTVMRMMDLIPTATPAQLAELMALLEADNASPRPAPNSAERLAEDRQTQAALTPDPPALAAPAPAAPSPAPSASAQVASTPPALAPPGLIPSAMAQPSPGPLALAPSAPTASTPAPAALALSRSGPSPSAAASSGSAPSAAATSAASPSSDQKSETIATAEPSQRPALSGRREPEPSQSAPSESVSSTANRGAVLYARGLDAELHGDFSAARRFYGSAAQKGDAAAARNLGRLYDPAYLKQTALGGIDPDPAMARHWYERAIRLGDAEAATLLEALSVR